MKSNILYMQFQGFLCARAPAFTGEAPPAQLASRLRPVQAQMPERPQALRHPGRQAVVVRS